MEVIPDHIKPPDCVQLRASQVDTSRTGVFCVTKIAKDTEFGPYNGKIMYCRTNEAIHPQFSWEVFDLETFRFLHIVDATDPANGNWMRYVCCARYFEEQNIVSTQHGKEVYYRALKDIDPGEELLTWFQPKKRKDSTKRKRSLPEPEVETPVEDPPVDDTTSDPPASPGGRLKRKRKPKIFPDAYQGPLDFPESKKVRQSFDFLFEPLQPGQKRRRRKKIYTDGQQSSSSSGMDVENAEKQDSNELSNGFKTPEEESSKDGSTWSTAATNDDNKARDIGRKENGQPLSISDINSRVDWRFPEKGDEYLFELKSNHVTNKNGRKVYKCDICMGLYKHMFSLKRHYLRNHVNYRYLSKADMTNCLINLAQVVQNMRERGLEIPTARNYENNDKPGIGSGLEIPNKDNLVRESGEHEAVDTKFDDEKPADAIARDVKVKMECDDIDRAKINGDEESTCKDIDRNEANTDSDKAIVSDKASVSEQNDEDFVNNDGTENTNDKSDHQSSSKTGVNELRKESVDSVESSDTSKELMNGKNDTESEKDKSTEQTGEKTERANQNQSQELPCFDSIESPKMTYSEFNMYGDRARPMPGLFRCYTCYDVFDTVEAVRDHVQNHPQQEEGTCFSCDQCNMRFNYKQNLVRHKRVHEMADHPVVNGSSPVPSLNSSKSEDLINANTNTSPPTQLPTSLDGPLSQAGPGSEMTEGGARLHPQRPDTYQMFKCSKCKTKFESLEEMTAHVKAEHISGNKFQCQYCGKDFPSGPNMKKHVRFHLGYRVSCRYCPEVFPNVGALRKHTRISHVDIYKAKLLDKLDADENTKKSGVANNSEAKQIKLLDTNDSKGKAGVENSKNSKKEKDNYIYDHDISFAADEIDDGGSRFKFSCTVCKKRFSNYINMCRHRRKSHSHDKPRHEELSLSFCHKRKNTVSPVQEDPEEVAQFFANVSHNIATNLNCFIDGQSPALEKFVDHIKIEDYGGNFGYNPVVDTTPIDLTWSKYNFPPDFKPVKTVGVTTIVKQEDIEQQEKVEENKPSANKESDIASNKPENRDTCVSKVNSSSANKESGIVNNKSESRVSISRTSSDSTLNSSNEMGRKSSEVKMLTGLANSHKQTSSVTDLPPKSDKKFYQFKISNGSIEYSSPVVKKFLHVENGEYANFEDDLEPSDDDVVREKGTEMSRSRHTSRTDRRKAISRSRDTLTGHSSSSIDEVEKAVEDKADVDKLMEAAQAELDELYDSIENCTSEGTKQLSVHSENSTHNHRDMKLQKQSPVKRSPEPLSLMCEKLLGIRKRGPRKDNYIVRTDIEDGQCDNLLLKQLNLASQQSAKIKLNNGAKTVVPDYSDVPDGSPFYNYESIAFGTNGQVVSVCAICRKHFQDIEAVLRHHWKKHPGSVFQILEVEQGNDIDSLHFQEPSYVGALAVTDPGLNNLNSMEIFTCTKCGSVFRSVSRLHVHIVNCSPIDPVYGSKVERSPHKISLSKKIQKKFNSLLGKDQSSKSELELLKNGITSQEIKSQKRVFIGCRKRKSMLLPDSPVKVGQLQVPISPLRAGYNPNRHIRRRELIELIDTLTCEACGLKFKTIILLERHVKHCTKKEKFKNVQPLACPILDESLARIKNICFYCEKNFTYAKSLINHFADFCQVKKARQDRGQLTDHDKLQEKEIVERLKKLEEEKLMKDPDHVKKKITWQTGRKVKRKGHSWTAVKKRKQPENDENDTQEGVDEDDKESIEADHDSLEIDKDNPSQDKDKQVVEKESVTVNKDSIVTGMEIATGEKSSAVTAIESVTVDRDSVGTERDSIQGQEEPIEQSSVPATVCKKDKEGTSATRNQTCNGFDEVDSASEKPEETSSEASTTINDDGDSDVENSCDTDLKDSFRLAEETPINDMSLNCTSRYQVNQVIQTGHKNKTSKTNSQSSSKPSLLFNCISKAVDQDFEPKVAKNNVPAPQKGFPADANSLIMPSKRKRERVSKVEEFLRNAFRRKRSSKNTKSEETSKAALKENSVQLSSAENEVNIVQTKGDPSEEKAQKPVRKRGRPKKVILENDSLNTCPPVPEKGDIMQPGITPVLEKHQGPGKINNKQDEADQEIKEQQVTETHETEHLTSIIELVNSAIVNDEDKKEDEVDSLSSEKDKIMSTMLKKGIDSSKDEDSEADEHKSEVSNCDSDDDNHEDTVVAVLMDCLAESNNEDILSAKQTSEVLNCTDQVGIETMNIDHELSLPNSEQRNITAEVIGDILTMQESKTDMQESKTDMDVPEESEGTVNQEEVSGLEGECDTSYDDLTDNHSEEEIQLHENKLDVLENDVSYEFNEQDSSTSKAADFEQAENVAANNDKNNTDDISIKQEQKVDVSVDETRLIETEEVNSSDKSVFNEETKVPSATESGDVKDEQKSKDSDISECDSGSDDKVTTTADESQKEKSSSGDVVESSEMHDSAIPKSPDPASLEKYEPVLSPSERVKMNKRSSAMKSSSPYVPVWTRKPSKPRLKSPDRKTTSDKATSDSEKKGSETETQSKTKKSAEMKTKPIEMKNKLVTPDSPGKKIRQNAINENLKLLHKRVTLQFEENMRAEDNAVEIKSKPTVLPSAGAADKKVAEERFGTTRASRSSPLRGVKRKPSEEQSKDLVDTNPEKRRSVSGKVVEEESKDAVNIKPANRRSVSGKVAKEESKDAVDIKPANLRSVSGKVAKEESKNPVNICQAKQRSVTGVGNKLVKCDNSFPTQKRTRMNAIEAAIKEKASAKDKKVVKGRGIKR